jgi:hypothetical protein
MYQNKEVEHQVSSLGSSCFGVDRSQGLATVAVGSSWCCAAYLNVPRHTRKHAGASRTILIVAEVPLLAVFLDLRRTIDTRMNEQCSKDDSFIALMI